MSRRVLQVLSGLLPGGAERFVFDLSKELKNKFEWHVISLSFDKGNMEISKRFVNDAVSLEVFNFKGVKFLVKIKKLVELLFFLKKNKIEIIHAHMFHSLCISVIAKIVFPNIKIIFTLHTSRICLIRKIIIFLTKAFRNRDIIFSESMRSNIYKKNVEIIPNGIDIMKFNNIEKYRIFTFVMIGRLEFMKNHNLVLQILARYPRSDWNLLIVGEGSLYNELRSMVIELGLSNRVKFLGFRNDISNILSKSHVFLMPSKWEGMPISLLEAGASGVPIITTPVGSVPEVVKDMACVVLEEDFLGAMIFVQSNYSEACKKAEKFEVEVKEKYSMKKILERYINLYENI
jgi:glycosyltransferase involved in cell wall biosynthesis